METKNKIRNLTYIKKRNEGGGLLRKGMDSTRIQMPFMSERNRKMENNEQDFINIINATENNLKHVSLKIPKKQITVFTGVSGSGKSSLCLDTIAAESRRELNVTFPSFVQQFLPKYGRPEVDRMENLPGSRL